MVTKRRYGSFVYIDSFGFVTREMTIKEAMVIRTDRLAKVVRVHNDKYGF